MNIGTWNTRSIEGKEIELVNEVKKCKIYILGITETKKKDQGIENLGSNTPVYSGVNTNERARVGVALLLRNNVYELCDFIRNKIEENKNDRKKHWKNL